MFPYIKAQPSHTGYENDICLLSRALKSCDAVIIGAGAGLSAAAGFTYSGERFASYFSDFEKKYGFHDMYSGGFYPYKTSEEYWAYWSRYVFVNRYMDPPEPVYSMLFDLVKGKDYFVLTTNVDHCFQKAGFDKDRIFYTQGDYGLFQCSGPCEKITYENSDIIREMLISQGFSPDFAKKSLAAPRGEKLKMEIPSGLIPRCPRCGSPMTMNLRADDKFAEDEGWHNASKRYSGFIRRHQGLHNLYLELGVGYNTPGIIKFPFWQMTARNDNAVYACLNLNEAFAPEEIAGRSICINDDIADVLKNLCGRRECAG